MVERKTPGEIILLVFIYAAVTLVGFVCLYPMLYCLAASFSDPMKLLTHSGALFFPTGFSLRGYQVVMNNPNILIGYRNTLLYVAGSLIVGMTLTPLGAYALSCKGYPFRKAIVFLFVFTMYFSGGLIPTYTVVRSLHLTNSRLGIILLGSVSVYNIILIRSYFRSSLPEELREAAEIDGCSNLDFFFQIALPLATPIIAVIAMYIAEGMWNSYFNAMVYLTDIDKYPLQNFLREILLQGEANTDLTDPETAAERAYIMQMLKYCVIVLSSLPMMLLYPFIQRFFVTGLMIGSLKG